MADYSNTLFCPSCNMRDLNLTDYISLMVVKPGLGLFTLECPNCRAKITSIQAIPPELSDTVNKAAAELNAGMGIC